MLVPARRYIFKEPLITEFCCKIKYGALSVSISKSSIVEVPS
jgi:hypothetical protein